MDLMVRVRQVATAVTDQYIVADILPLIRAVELLVKYPVPSEGLRRNPAVKLKVLEAFLERREFAHLRI